MSHYLYVILNLGSLSIPLLYSIFEKDFHFIQYFKKVCISIILVAIPFLIWDAIFTAQDIWGFNASYYLGITILKMPIEEWLFFYCIPYACLFTHEVLKFYFPKFILSKSHAIILSFLLIIFSFFLLIFNLDKSYTLVNFTFFLFLIVIGLKYHLKTLQEYYPSFLIIMIPFLLVNGVLTGSFIQEPVVWYNNLENLNFRIFTIPFEDFFYAFNLLFSIQLLFNKLTRNVVEQ